MSDVTDSGDRFGVFGRPSRGGRGWQLLAVAPTEDAARKMMLAALGSRRGGKWWVTRSAPDGSPAPRAGRQGPKTIPVSG
jgi:hypothetical protein